jgi:hypothetical protein
MRNPLFSLAAWRILSEMGLPTETENGAGTYATLGGAGEALGASQRGEPEGKFEGALTAGGCAVQDNKKAPEPARLYTHAKIGPYQQSTSENTPSELNFHQYRPNAFFFASTVFKYICAFIQIYLSLKQIKQTNRGFRLN